MKNEKKKINTPLQVEFRPPRRRIKSRPPRPSPPDCMYPHRSRSPYMYVASSLVFLLKIKLIRLSGLSLTTVLWENRGPSWGTTIVNGIFHEAPPFCVPRFWGNCIAQRWKSEGIERYKLISLCWKKGGLSLFQKLWELISVPVKNAPSYVGGVAICDGSSPPATWGAEVLELIFAIITDLFFFLSDHPSFHGTRLCKTCWLHCRMW